MNKRKVKKILLNFTFHIQRSNIHFKCKILHLNILIVVDKTCEKALRLNVEHDFNKKSESRKFSFLVEKSNNKSVINFNFARQEDLSTLKSDIYLGLAVSVNYHFFGKINPHVYLIEVDNCTILHSHDLNFKNVF